VFNIYWHGNDWDDLPQHKPNSSTGSIGFQKKDIDAATRALLSSGYFAKSCQYGVPNLVWAGSHDNGQLLNPCPNPSDPVTLAQVQGFAAARLGVFAPVFVSLLHPSFSPTSKEVQICESADGSTPFAIVRDEWTEGEVSPASNRQRRGQGSRRRCLSASNQWALIL
jgi:hypothetical protein